MYKGSKKSLNYEKFTHCFLQSGIRNTSDQNFKEEVRELPPGLDFVKILKPVHYIRRNSEERLLEAGFIARDVREALDEADYEDAGLPGEDSQGNLTLRYTDLIPVLTKAIKEQNALIGLRGEEIERPAPN